MILPEVADWTMQWTGFLLFVIYESFAGIKIGSVLSMFSQYVSEAQLVSTINLWKLCLMYRHISSEHWFPLSNKDPLQLNLLHDPGKCFLLTYASVLNLLNLQNIFNQIVKSKPWMIFLLKFKWIFHDKNLTFFCVDQFTFECYLPIFFCKILV